MLPQWGFLYVLADNDSRDPLLLLFSTHTKDNAVFDTWKAQYCFFDFMRIDLSAAQVNQSCLSVSQKQIASSVLYGYVSRREIALGIKWQGIVSIIPRQHAFTL